MNKSSVMVATQASLPLRNRRLSPLSHKHINMLGRYHFAPEEPITHGELRPSRDPSDPSEQEFAA